MRTSTRRTGIAALLLLSLWVACIQEPGGEPRGLLVEALDREIELEAPAGHHYYLELPADSFVRLVIDQRGVDLEARLFDPRGRLVDRADGAGGPWLEERLAASVGPAGRYRLEIHAQQATAGHYRVALAEARPAEPDDDQRLSAENLYRQGRHQRHVPEERKAAVESFRQAVEIWQRLGDGDRELEARDEQADLLLESGEPASVGLAVIAPAFALAREPAQEARILETRAWLQEETADAIADFERCLELVPQGSQRADCLDGLGDIYYLDDRESERAGDLFAEACRVREAAGDLAGLATSLSNLGLSKHMRRHHRDEVLPLYQRSLELARTAQRWPQVSTSLNNLGYFLRYHGLYEDALERFEERFELARRMGEKDALGGSYLNLGTVYAIRGRTQKAIESLEHAVRIYRQGEDPAEISDALLHLGWAHDALRNHQQAHDSFAEASALAPQAPWPRIGLGRTLTQLARPQEGLQVLEAAYASLRGAERQCHAMLEIGTARAALEDVEGARTAFRRALDLAIEAGHSVEQPRVHGFASLARLGRLEASEGNFAIARRHLEEASEARERLSANLYRPEDRAKYRELGYVVYEASVDALVGLHRENPGAGHDVEALVASERARARALAEWLTEAQVEVALSPQLEEDQRNNARGISAAQQQIARLLSTATPDPELVAGERQRLTALKRERSRLISEIRKAHPEYAEISYPDPIGLDEVRAYLTADTALLEYFVGSLRSYLFIVRRDRFEIVELAPGAEIQAAVETARRALGQGSRLQELADTRTAFELLVAPAEPFLEGIERLIISPDQSLHYLPFEALWVSPQRLASHQRASSEDFLIGRWTVSYTPSASTLAYVPEAGRAAPYRLAAFSYGGPDGQTADGKTYAALQHAEEEVRRIATLFDQDQVRVLSGEAALEGRIKETLSDSRLVHFAVHGAISEQDILDSALLLAADATEDGLLQVAEIFGLELSADLVVLSACETALGREIRGEGLLGLSHAFFTAGARSLMVSLWKVDDRSTERLMTAFYEGLTGGLDSAAAARRAKISLIDGEASTSHPYYWAPFVLVGPSEVL
ncbi:MAG: CHAT domain-containing tetratricopeptide repeat protein [Acidobacteriota bacterium]